MPKSPTIEQIQSLQQAIQGCISTFKTTTLSISVTGSDQMEIRTKKEKEKAIKALSKQIETLDQAIDELMGGWMDINSIMNSMAGKHEQC